MCNMCQTDTFKSGRPIKEDYLLIQANDIFNCSDWMFLVIKLFKRAICADIEFRTDISYGEDKCFLFEIFKKDISIALGKQAKYYYRKNPMSANHKFKASHLKEIELREEWLKYAKEYDLKVLYISELGFNLWHISRWLHQLGNMAIPDRDSVNYLVSFLRKNWFTCFFRTKTSIQNKCFLALCCINFPLASRIYRLIKGNKK